MNWLEQSKLKMHFS